MTILSTLAATWGWLIAWLGSCLLLGIACWGRLGANESNRKPAWPNPEMAIFLCVCTGLAVQVLVLIGLALAGMLNPAAIIGSFLALTVASGIYLYLHPAAREEFSNVFRIDWFEWLTVLPVLLIILPWILRPLGAPYGTDALTYHLPYAQFYLDQGGLAVNETLRFPLHTHNVNLLYSVALLAPGFHLAQALHASMAFLALLGSYGTVRHWYGWLAAALAAAGPFLLLELHLSFTYAFADNAVLLFVTAAFLSMALWVDSRQQRLLWMSALFAGTAMGTKYFGALFTVPLGLTLLWFSRDFKLFIRFALLTSVFGLFWYIRSFWISGNPVHPFAGNIFGHYLWNASDLAGSMRELTSWGLEKTWKNFALLPILTFSEWRSFNGYMGSVGVLIGGFYLSFLLIRFQKPVVRTIQITCLAYLLFWFWTSQVVRYLMLIVPLMSVVTVCAFASTWSHFMPAQKVRSPAIQSLLLVPILVTLGWFGIWQLQTDNEKMPLTPESQASKLARDLPAYYLGKAASVEPRIGDGPLLQIQVPEIRSFYNGIVVGDWIGVHPFKNYGHVGDTGHWVIDKSPDLYEKVTRAGFKAVAFNKSPRKQFKPQEISGYREHFEIIYESRKGVLMIPRQDIDQ